MNANDSKPPLSSYRFRELEPRETPAPEKTEAQKAFSEKAAQLHAQARVGRFSEAHHKRVEQAQTFAKNGRAVTHGEVGQDPNGKASPMQKDAPPLDQLKEKPPRRAGMLYPQPTPGGTLWSHAPGAGRSQPSQAQKQQASGQGKPGDGKKLEFFADKNPEHDKTPSPTR